MTQKTKNKIERLAKTVCKRLREDICGEIGFQFDGEEFDNLVKIEKLVLRDVIKLI